MSFIIDPPLLLLCGLAIYFLGQRLKWSRFSRQAASQLLPMPI